MDHSERFWFNYSPEKLIKAAKEKGYYKGVTVEWWGIWGLEKKYDSGFSTISELKYCEFMNQVFVILENGKEFAVAGKLASNPPLLIIPDHLFNTLQD